MQNLANLAASAWGMIDQGGGKVSSSCAAFYVILQKKWPMGKVAHALFLCSRVGNAGQPKNASAGFYEAQPGV